MSDLPEGWSYDYRNHDGGKSHVIGTPIWYRDDRPGIMYLKAGVRHGWQLLVRDRPRLARHGNNCHWEEVPVAEVMRRVPIELHIGDRDSQ